MPRFAFQPLPEKPLVSVILTSYNYADFVGDAIRSVFAQTWRPMELIVVDDGSSDASPAIIRDLTRDAPIPVHTIFQRNAGQASAWNAAFEKVQGELVCFLDSDDTWQPGKVAAMVALAHQHPQAGLYQHQMDNAAGKLKADRLISRDVLRDWVALGKVDVLRRHDLVALFLPSSGLMARREVLERVFPIPPRLVTCPDAYLTRSCCIFGPLQSTHEVLGTWREHGQNAGVSDRFGFQRFWLPVVMPAINASFHKHGVPVEFECPPRNLRQRAQRFRQQLRSILST